MMEEILRHCTNVDATKRKIKNIQKRIPNLKGFFFVRKSFSWDNTTSLRAHLYSKFTR